MLLVYSEPVTSRLRYIARLLLGDLYGIDLSFTDNPDEFTAWQGPGICYSERPGLGGLRIHPASLLAETNLYDSPVGIDHAGGIPVLFPAAGGDLPFDVFAASFYMVTRYEEYLNSKKDKYGRFIPSESITLTNGFVKQPVVNLWAGMLVRQLQKRYPGLELRPRSYKFVSTIDIDHAYAYRNRTLFRTLGGIGRSVIRAEFSQLAERFGVLAGVSRDPFDCYDFIRSFHREQGIEPHYFILFADYGGNDNNVSLTGSSFRQLLARLSDEAVVGIHPSLSSNRHPERLEREIAGLSAATGREITSSRQHFLKFSFPKTFRHLVTNGITDDYSMGYASVIGFRAGMASPFHFFDLFRNEVTPLLIHPVAAMDVTFRDYLHLPPAESLDQMKQLADTVRSVNGEFITLWHNESLSDTGRWKGWRKVFEETVAYSAGLMR